MKRCVAFVIRLNFMNMIKNNIVQRIAKDLNLKDINLSIRDLNLIWNDDEKRKIIETRSKNISLNSIILVKNQENKIRTSIKSALDHSDHLYIFDTGSNDKTVEVIKNLLPNKKLTFKQIEWKENYSYMRNLAASFVPDGWVLLLDSDEVLDKKIDIRYIKIILSFLEYLFNDKDISLEFRQTDEETSIYTWVERLYKKTNTIKFFGYVHEELRSKKLIRVQTMLTINNSGTRKDEIKKFNKLDRYFKLSLKNYQIEPNNIKWISLMPLEEALKYNSTWYLKILKNYMKQIDNDLLKSAHAPHLICNYIEAILYSEMDIKKALNITEWAIKKYPQDIRFYIYKFTLENGRLSQDAKNIISQFREVIPNIEKGYASENNKWLPASSPHLISLLENNLVDLLFKSENYDIAKKMINSKNKSTF